MGRFIKDNDVEVFMNRVAVEASGGEASGRTAVSTPEEAMMGRMGILVVCRFERLLVEEQVRFAAPGRVISRENGTRRRLGNALVNE